MHAQVHKGPGAWRGLALVLGLGLAARLLVLAEIRDGPFLWLHTWSESDMHFFDRWAQAVAAGDLLTREGMHPYHSRHREIACASLAFGSSQPEICDDATVKDVWNSWIGEKRFWQDPFYPYALGWLYSLVGRGPYVGYTLNLACGLVSIGLIWSIARGLGGLAAANVSGTIAAIYGPFLFYETLLLREAMVVLAALATVRLLMAVAASPERRWCAIAAGASAGLSVLLRASALLFVPVALALIALHSGQGRGRAGMASLCFLAGAALVLSPLVARNATLGVPPLALAASGPLNFINGNAADRLSGGGSSVSAHAPAILAQTGGDPARVIVATLRTHDSLASWLGLLWRKLAGFWHWYEIPDNASYEYFRLQAPLAVNLLLSWPWILPLAFLGACEVLRRPAGQVLLAHVAVGLITCVLFYNLSRFRLPVAACLLALVGPGAVGLASRWGQGSRTKVVSGLAAAIALMLVASRPWERVTPLIRLADYGVANEITEHRARRRLAAGDASGALELVERQLRTEPPELSALTPTAEAFNIPGHLARVAGAFVVLHEMAADLDGRLGQPAAAESHAGRAAMLRRIEARHRAAGLEQ